MTKKAVVVASLLVLVTGLVFALGAFSATAPDSDGDGIPDSQDACPLTYDYPVLAAQTGPNGQVIHDPDWDHDGIGNICDATPGMPGDRRDIGLFFRASDGSRVAKCAGIQYTWHYDDGSTLNQSQDCTVFLGFSGGFEQVGRRITSVDVTVSHNPEGCSDPSSSTVTLDATQGGVYLRKSIYFQGASCGIGITKPATAPPTTTVPPVPAPAPAPPPSGASTVRVNDTLVRTGQSVAHTVAVPAGTSTVTIVVKWTKPGASFALARLHEDGASLTASTTRTKTSLTVRVSGVDAGTLAYTVVAKKVAVPTAVTIHIKRR